MLMFSTPSGATSYVSTTCQTRPSIKTGKNTINQNNFIDLTCAPCEAKATEKGAKAPACPSMNIEAKLVRLPGITPKTENIPVGFQPEGFGPGGIMSSSLPAPIATGQGMQPTAFGPEAVVSENGVPVATGQGFRRSPLGPGGITG